MGDGPGCRYVDPQKTDFKFASGIALCLTFQLTVPVAGYLSNAGGHFVGPPDPADARIWLLGWSREVGDLRVAHLFATHVMQILPVGAAILALFLRPNRVQPTFLIAAAAYIIFVGLVFFAAIKRCPAPARQLTKRSLDHGPPALRTARQKTHDAIAPAPARDAALAVSHPAAKTLSKR